MAKELKSKAGDNQALVTLADTMRDDHKDNQTALSRRWPVRKTSS